ncbi:MAG: S8 family serine peptidase [Bacteroidales bacterium]|nr:S8 family serine peptidase [Bacteroidales bacterium]
MNRQILLSLVMIWAAGVSGQVSPDKYWIQFTDKNNSPYSIENPEEFLSQRAIDRRVKYDITITVQDLPVNPLYVEAVVGTGVTLLNRSKWFNSVTIYTTDQNAINTISGFSFVKSVMKSAPKPGGTELVIKPFFGNESFSDDVSGFMLKNGKTFDYGLGYNQIHMLNGDLLHDMGYRGEGMVIAVLDAGFRNADQLVVFDSLWAGGRILGYKDFVDPLNPNIFDSHNHGTMVLSTMGANWPGMLVGTAPMASYWLLRSEDGGSEYLIEELNWVSAAEFADSTGADVINSSLGYSVFDDPMQSHSYEDMDGNTTPITIGADIAAGKGMIVVSSAGNEGGSSWQYITAPADGDSVFTIGAVDEAGNYAGFSSTGPTYDGRLKPNVVAQGQGSAIVKPSDGTIITGSGTSFSAPIMAGMVACLWQANPEARNTEIMNTIEESASLHSNPDNLMGNGIPDMALANTLFTHVEHTATDNQSIRAFPVPFENTLTLWFGRKLQKEVRVTITDLSGRQLFNASYTPYGSDSSYIHVHGLGFLAGGSYILTADDGIRSDVVKVAKR